MTGTYAGQFVMEGFIRMKLKPWVRATVTRSTAILPSLLVALIAGDSGSNSLIVLSQVVLSVVLPFALVPLLKFTNHVGIMGTFANHGLVRIVFRVLILYILLLFSLSLCLSLFLSLFLSHSLSIYLSPSLSLPPPPRFLPHLTLSHLHPSVTDQDFLVGSGLHPYRR